MLRFVNLTAAAMMVPAIVGPLFYLSVLLFRPELDAPLWQGLVPLFQFLMAFGVFFLNAWHRYRSAKLLIIFSGLTTITLMGLLFQQAGGDSLFFLVAPIAIFLFLGLNRFSMLLNITVFCIYLGVNYFHNHFPPIAPMPAALLQVNYTINQAIIYLMIGLLTYFLIRLNQGMEDRLHRLMETDSLTGLFNRRKYDVFSQNACSQAYQDQTPVSVILLDIDYFKAYNDTYGHLAADDCLVEVAEVLKACVHRRTDIVSRVGGEEFVVVLINTELKDTVHLAQTVLQQVEAKGLPHGQSKVKLYVTLSAGVASWIPVRESDFFDLFHAADQKLYEAKAKGRNQVVA
ncbi:MAG: GGDEF domain-containing protein [Hydrogenovibrio sp.]